MINFIDHSVAIKINNGVSRATRNPGKPKYGLDCDVPKVQGSKCELLWIKVGLCVYENGSSAKRGAILESCEKGSGFVKDSELFVLVCEIRER